MIRHGLPLSEYLAIDALSSGVAFEAYSRSPFHGRARQLEERRSSRVADKGSCVHQILLEGHDDGVVWIEADDFRTKAAKDARDAAHAACKIPMLAKERESVEAMCASVRAFVASSDIAGVFDDPSGKPEVTVEWHEMWPQPGYGHEQMRCKARPDYLTDKFHISVKTTAASAEPASWARRMLTANGYDFSLAFYDRGLKANGFDVEHRILVIEQGKPHGVSLVALDPTKQVLVDAQVEKAIETWRQCLATGIFPGYSPTTYWAEPTAWEISEMEEILI